MNSIERPNTIKETIFKWKQENIAPTAKVDQFWRELRRFYRTGEKNDDNNNDGLKSACLNHLNTIQSKYPFELGGTNYEISSELPIVLLNHSIKELEKEKRYNFQIQLNGLNLRLQSMLQLIDEEKEAKQLSESLDFADALITFDEMVKLMPKKGIENIPDARLSRLQSIFKTLQDGIEKYAAREAIIIATKDFSLLTEVENLIDKATILKGESDPFQQALEVIEKEMKSFVELIKAVRIAGLELDDSYAEEIHDDYFEHFNWHRLKKDELALFHPIILCVDQDTTIDHLTTFSKVLSFNQPIKTFVFNRNIVSAPHTTLSWEDASHQIKQELSTFTISHRNVYYSQSGMDDPEILNEGIADCLRHSSAGICHFLIHSESSNSEQALVAKGATMSRFFPTVVYNPYALNTSNSRLNLSANFQYEDDYTSFTLEAQTTENSVASIDVSITYADYKALFPTKIEELMIVPSKYYSEYLIPLSEYLELEESQLYGRIPYIWLVDADRQIQRAAVPYAWVVSCQERVDFWRFLKEMGGMKTKIVSSENGEELNKDTQTINEENQSTITEEEAINKAAQRLITALLDDNL